MIPNALMTLVGGIGVGSIDVSAALEEWGMNLDDLDDVEVSVPEGQISAAEHKSRKG